MFAFQCLNCGQLAGPEEASPTTGIPAACSNCGHGITIDIRTARWHHEPANWLVLAALKPAELKPVLDKFGIDASDVVAVAVPASPEE